MFDDIVGLALKALTALFLKKLENRNDGFCKYYMTNLLDQVYHLFKLENGSGHDVDPCGMTASTFSQREVSAFSITL